LGLMAMATPDATARSSRTIVSGPSGTAVISRRTGRVAAVRGLRGARGAVITTSRPGLTCRTVIGANGVRVRRCW
jgi:hypothetical protein